jgi:acyl-CoA synthetase (NDP forming)
MAFNERDEGIPYEMTGAGDLAAETRNDVELGNKLFRPRTVALVGASADPSKINFRPLRYLREAGYDGQILPINPGRKEIGGLPAHADLASVPGPIDHAFIMVPAPAVEAVIRQCAQKQVPVATIFSSGFAERGEEGRALQRRIVEIAREGGVRLLGPNCIGLINIHGRLPLTTNAAVAEERLLPGSISVISQSGSMLGSLLTRAVARGVGFSKMVSIGNESDLGVGELVSILADDPETEVVLLFLEAFRDGDRLAQAARKAFAKGKPVIAFKLGRSAIGRRVAASHTGALAGADEVAQAFFRHNGILRVETLEALLELPQMVKGKRPPAGRRAAVMTATGGAAAMIVDRLGLAGDEIPSPPESFRNHLKTRYGIDIPDAPLIDLPMGTSGGGRYSTILSELLTSDHCDAVVSVVGSSSRSNPEIVRERILDAKPGEKRKPLAVFLAPQADEGLKLLQDAGVAGFRTPESAADAVHAYLTWRAPVPRVEVADKDVAAARAIWEEGGSWHELRAGRFFAALGVPMAETILLDEKGQARTPSRASLSGPAAVKILSSDILHKSDAGLVALNVSGDEVASKAREIAARAREAYPNARIEGVLAQKMEKGLAEVIIGYRHDPEVGPIVVLGIGGIAAEIHRSVSVRLAPVDMETAAEMIREVPELKLLAGFRNRPPGDLEALARAIVGVSRAGVASSRQISDAEINPLLVKEAGHGVIAVDALVVAR